MSRPTAATRAAQERSFEAAPRRVQSPVGRFTETSPILRMRLDVGGWPCLTRHASRPTEMDEGSGLHCRPNHVRAHQRCSSTAYARYSPTPICRSRRSRELLQTYWIPTSVRARWAHWLSTLGVYSDLVLATGHCVLVPWHTQQGRRSASPGSFRSRRTCTTLSTSTSCYRWGSQFPRFAPIQKRCDTRNCSRQPSAVKIRQSRTRPGQFGPLSPKRPNAARRTRFATNSACSTLQRAIQWSQSTMKCQRRRFELPPSSMLGCSRGSFPSHPVTTLELGTGGSLAGVWLSAFTYPMRLGNDWQSA